MKEKNKTKRRGAMAFRCIHLALIGLIIILLQLNSGECARLPIDVIEEQQIECTEANWDEERCANYRLLIDDGQQQLSAENQLRYSKLVANLLDLIDSGLIAKPLRPRETKKSIQNIQKKLEKQKTLKDFFNLRY